jgi:hypothetical protein
MCEVPSTHSARLLHTLNCGWALELVNEKKRERESEREIPSCFLRERAEECATQEIWQWEEWKAVLCQQLSCKIALEATQGARKNWQKNRHHCRPKACLIARVGSLGRSLRSCSNYVWLNKEKETRNTIASGSPERKTYTSQKEGRNNPAGVHPFFFFKGESLRYVLSPLYALPHLHVILPLPFLLDFFFFGTLNHNHGTVLV